MAESKTVLGLTLEDESRIMQEGLKGQFWKVICARFEDLTKANQNALKGQPNKDWGLGQREWLAGRLTGMEAVLKYPENHAKTLEEAIKHTENSKSA